MATISGIGDVMQLQVRARALGQEVMNVWYARLQPGYSSASFATDYLLFEQMALDLLIPLNTNMLPLLASNYGLYAITVQRISGAVTDPGPPITNRFSFDLGFTFYYDPLVYFGGRPICNTTITAWSALLHTGGPRRYYQGSKRFGPLQDDKVDQNTILPPLPAELEAAANVFITDWTAAGVASFALALPVVASANQRALGINFSEPILVVSGSQIPGSQVSRKAKRIGG